MLALQDLYTNTNHSSQQGWHQQVRLALCQALPLAPFRGSDWQHRVWSASWQARHSSIQQHQGQLLYCSTSAAGLCPGSAVPILFGIQPTPIPPSGGLQSGQYRKEQLVGPSTAAKKMVLKFNGLITTDILLLFSAPMYGLLIFMMKPPPPPAF